MTKKGDNGYGNSYSKCKDEHSTDIIGHNKLLFGCCQSMKAAEFIPFYIYTSAE